MFSVLASIALSTLAATVSAQSTTTSASATAVTHNVVVGGSAGLVYTPNQIVANVGDIVTFEFQTKNHTVTQSAFATPCQLLVNATTSQTGFDSGFVPVSANATSFPTWSIEVTATTPIWFYCQQTGHCEQGMVGAINAPTNGSKTFAAFQALAMSGAANTTSNTTTTTGTGTGTGTGTSSSSSSSSTGTSGSTSKTSGAEVQFRGLGLGLLGVLGGMALLF